MDILEKTKELGMAIAECDLMKAVKDAEAAQDSDEAAQSMIKSYNEERTALMSQAREAGMTPEVMEDAKTKMQESFNKLLENEVISNYVNARKSFDNLTTQINNILGFYITGEEQAEGCSGSCSSCGGGCN